MRVVPIRLWCGVAPVMVGLQGCVIANPAVKDRTRVEDSRGGEPAEDKAESDLVLDRRSVDRVATKLATAFREFVMREREHGRDVLLGLGPSFIDNKEVLNPLANDIRDAALAMLMKDLAFRSDPNIQFTIAMSDKNAFRGAPMGISVGLKRSPCEAEAWEAQAIINNGDNNVVLGDRVRVESCRVETLMQIAETIAVRLADDLPREGWVDRVLKQRSSTIVLTLGALKNETQATPDGQLDYLAFCVFSRLHEDETIRRNFVLNKSMPSAIGTNEPILALYLTLYDCVSGSAERLKWACGVELRPKGEIFSLSHFTTPPL